MMTNINVLKGNFTFDSTTLNVSYDLVDSDWDGSHTLSVGANYYFDSSTKNGFSDFSSFQNAATLWEAYSVFSFSYNPQSSADVVVFAADTLDNLPSNNQGPATAWTYKQDYSGTEYSSAEIVFDNDRSLSTAAGFRTILHELGHALGLEGDHAASAFNSDQTVMTYSIAGGNRYPVTPMAFDILALEEMYGASQNETGNTSYSTSGNWITGGNRSLTIKDDGGVDEIDLSGIAGDHTINLKEAIDAQGQWTDSATIVNGQEYIYLSKGTVIENATGGSGDDTLIGNDADNVLFGGDGADSLKFYDDFGDDVVSEGEKLFINDVEITGEAEQLEVGGDAYRLGDYIFMKQADGSLKLEDGGGNSVHMSDWSETNDYGISHANDDRLISRHIAA